MLCVCVCVYVASGSGRVKGRREEVVVSVGDGVDERLDGCVVTLRCVALLCVVMMLLVYENRSMDCLSVD